MKSTRQVKCVSLLNLSVKGIKLLFFFFFLCLIRLSEQAQLKREEGASARLHSDILMRTFWWVSIQFQDSQLSTIPLITAESVCRRAHFAPAGERLNGKLSDICHIKGSWNVPGSFLGRGGMKLQWHDGLKAGVPVAGLKYWRHHGKIPTISLFYLSAAAWLKHTTWLIPCPLLLFSRLVNPVINHPLTVTELLLIVISPLPCWIVFVPWFSPFRWTYVALNSYITHIYIYIFQLPFPVIFNFNLLKW